MPTYKLKGGVYQNVDEIGLDGLSPILINGYVDEFDNTNKRFGYELWVDLGSGNPIKGLFYWQQKGCVIAVSNGNILKVSADKTVTNKTTNALTNKTNPAIFASDSGATWIASGGKMVLLEWNVSENNAIFVADTDAPTAVSHVAYLDGYIIANSVGSHKWYWTSPLDRADWNSLDMASAEANPDIIVALHSFWRELYLFGQNTVEIWYNAGGDAPFERLGGGVIEVGCAAPYSIVRSAGTIFWLDDKRRFVKLTGRQVQSTSQPIQKLLDGLPLIADTVCYPIAAKGRNFIILNMLSANQTWCYDVDLNQWAMWGDWNTSLSYYDMYRGISNTVINSTTATSFIENKQEPLTANNVCSEGELQWNNPSGIIKDNANYTTSNYSNSLLSQQRYAGTVVNASCFGVSNWIYPHNAQGAPDGSPTVNEIPINSHSNCLYARNFGFTIPSNATIRGIVVSTYGACVTGVNRARDQRAILRKADGTYGIGIMSDSFWDSTFQWVHRGRSDSLCGFTSITPAEINDQDFTFEIALANLMFDWSSTVQIDCFQITVYYSVADISCHLTATNFNFNVPAGVTIQGAKCVMNVENMSGIGVVGVKDKNVQLVVNGSRAGENKSNNSMIQTNTQHSYGNFNDSWGLSLNQSIVNAPNFGVAFQIEAFGGSIRIYELRLQVYYSFSTSPFSVGTGILIGDRYTGNIWEKKVNYFKDNTKAIRLERRSGNITHNTLRTKRCRKLTMRFKRGVGNTEVPSPSFKLRWRDNNNVWSQTRTISMGGQTETSSYQDLHRLGIYKSRQYEIVHDQPTDFIFIEAEEESEVLMS